MNPVSGVYIRPSCLSRIAACPGSARLEEHVETTLGRQEADEVADLGTKAHAHGEFGIQLLVKGAVRVRDIDTVIDELRDHMETVGDVDTWTRTCVLRYVKYVHALIVKHGVEPENVLVEHHLDGQDLGFPNGGTADAILIVPFKLAIVIDLKAGFLTQGDADQHDAIASYAIMAARTFSVKEVHVHLFQSRAVDEDQRASAAHFDAATLRATETWVRFTTAAAQDPGAPLHPSYNACRNCKALAYCTAAKEYVMDAMKAAAIPPDPDTWGKFLSDAKLMERCAEKAVDAGKARLKAGEKVTGWEFGPATTIKVIDDAGECFRRVAKLGDAYVTGFWASCSLSRSDLDKQCGGDRNVYDDLVIQREKAGSLRQTKTKPSA